MPHLRIVGRQQEAWANARKPNESAPDNMETRWCESLVDVGPSGDPVAKKHVRLASSNMDCASLEQWCEWFRAHQAQMQERGAGTMSLDVVDFSCNKIGDQGLSVLVDLLLEQPPRVLKLFNNQVSDAAPIEKLLSKGCPHELHISNNKIPIHMAIRLAIAAIRAEDESGDYLLPICGVKPLWLRVENQNPKWPLDRFACQLFPKLQEAKRPLGVCWVDGLTDCNPGKCTCAGGPRAIHLLHVGSSNMNSRRGMQRFVAGREDQSRGTGTRHHVEWRAAALKLGKSQLWSTPFLRSRQSTICRSYRRCQRKPLKLLR